MAIVKISDLPLVDQPVEGTDLFVVVQDNVTKKAYASDIQTYVGFEEIQYATAGQTVFNLTAMSYAPGGNNLMVFVDGVNQYEGLSYTETNSTRVTFSQGLHVGAVVKFSTVQTQTSQVASAGAVTYTAAGANAVATNVQAKLRETVSVKDFGAIGDGVNDDTAAFVAALAASYSVYVPVSTGGYVLSSLLTIPVDTALFGSNRQSTKLIHKYNGDMIQMLNGASLGGLWLVGQGATYTGRGIKMLGSDGKQRIENAQITDFDGECIYFEKDAGSQSSYSNLIANRRNSGTGTGRYAIVVENAVTTGTFAIPRKFTQIETVGGCAFDFGGANNFYVSNSFLGDLNFSTNSRAVLITACRLANATSLVIRGANHTIVGCDIYPQVTVSTIDNCALQGNSFNNAPVLVTSDNPRNLIDCWATTYTPSLTSGGTAPSLGNGALTGTYSIDGSRCFFEMSLTLGSTTTLGSGELRFSVPLLLAVDSICGQAWINIGGTNYTAVVKGAAGAAYVSVVRDTSGSVTYNSPAVFGSGDFIRIAGSFFAKGS